MTQPVGFFFSKENLMEFIILAVTHFVALLSPGPDFFLIVQASLRLPRIYGVAIALGIAVANGIYVFVTIVWLELLRDYVMITEGLKYFGAVYLLFIGTSLLCSAKENIENKTEGSFSAKKSLRFQFGIGFLSGILNPKNMVFYLSIFSLMIAESTGTSIRVLYGLWMFVVVFLWDVFLVYLLSYQSLQKCLRRKLFYVEKFSGTILISFGVSLIFF